MIQCHVRLHEILTKLFQLCLDVISPGSLGGRFTLVMKLQMLSLSQLLLQSHLIRLQEFHILLQLVSVPAGLS